YPSTCCNSRSGEQKPRSETAPGSEPSSKPHLALSQVASRISRAVTECSSPVCRGVTPLTRGTRPPPPSAARGSAWLRSPGRMGSHRGQPLAVALALAALGGCGPQRCRRGSLALPLVELLAQLGEAVVDAALDGRLARAGHRRDLLQRQVGAVAQR